MLARKISSCVTEVGSGGHSSFAGNLGLRRGWGSPALSAAGRAASSRPAGSADRLPFRQLHPAPPRRYRVPPGLLLHGLHRVFAEIPRAQRIRGPRRDHRQQEQQHRRQDQSQSARGLPRTGGRTANPPRVAAAGRAGAALAGSAGFSGCSADGIDTLLRGLLCASRARANQSAQPTQRRFAGLCRFRHRFGLRRRRSRHRCPVLPVRPTAWQLPGAKPCPSPPPKPPAGSSPCLRLENAISAAAEGAWAADRLQSSGWITRAVCAASAALICANAPAVRPRAGFLPPHPAPSALAWQHRRRHYRCRRGLRNRFGCIGQSRQSARGHWRAKIRHPLLLRQLHSLRHLVGRDPFRLHPFRFCHRQFDRLRFRQRFGFGQRFRLGLPGNTGTVSKFRHSFRLGLLLRGRRKFRFRHKHRLGFRRRRGQRFRFGQGFGAGSGSG